MFGVIVIAVLLDGDVGEVNEWIVDVAELSGVLGVAEAREAMRILIHAQRPIRCHQNIYSQIELLAADEQRVLDVSE